jgi:hypothetical protein
MTAADEFRSVPLTPLRSRLCAVRNLPLGAPLHHPGGRAAGGLCDNRGVTTRTTAA